jgi:thiamine pyrophosphate-dependent acetolactate synthase large subunit-like protein
MSRPTNDPRLANGLDRREAMRTLLENRGDMLLVTGLGSTTWDAAAAGDDERNFYLWGAMGAAAMVGLGLAIAKPKRRVLVVTGDGEMLMGLGSLATVGAKSPRNLAVVVLDNERYGETGMQKTHTAYGVDLAGIASACGFARVGRVTLRADLDRMRTAVRRQSGPLFFQVKVAPENPAPVLPPRDGAYLKHRFREALLGRRAAE